MIETGLRRSLRRGHISFKLAGREPSSENLHEWRKRVKDLWHHLQLICPKPPADIRMFIAHLALLGGQLGEEHNLYLLSQFVKENSSPAERRALNQLIDARQKKLRVASLKLGVLVFKKSSTVVCHRLKCHWLGCGKN